MKEDSQSINLIKMQASEIIYCLVQMFSYIYGFQIFSKLILCTNVKF